MRTHVRVDLSRIAQNFRSLRSACPPGGEVLAVVKANAYGHGALPTVQALEQAGCERFAVACLSEAGELREAGVEAEIVVLDGFLPGEEAEFVARRLTPVLHAPYQVDAWIARGTTSPDSPLPCHLKVNTGMNRLGVRLSEAPRLAQRLQEARGVRLDGIATHLASAEDFDDPAADEQIERFRSLLTDLEAAGVNRPRWKHFANTAGLAGRPPTGNLARCGLGLYGWLLETVGAAPAARLSVAPAMEWRCKVIAVHDVQRGDRIGYNGTFTAPGPMRIAALGVGYGDGYRRELSCGGRVRLNGCDCPVAGRISMDVTTVDASACPHVQPGDEAVLLGEGIGVHELAVRCGTIPYEILCGISARVPRIYDSAKNALKTRKAGR